MKKSLILIVLCVLTSHLFAQRINKRYDNVSMSAVLKDLGRLQDKYLINFVYDDLEDFRVSATIQAKNVSEAINQAIGFYPIQMKELDGNILLVECMLKADRRYKGRIVDEHGEPAEFANIALLSPQDSSMIGSGVSNARGYFVIPCEAEKVIARISYVGYKTLYRTYTRTDMGDVMLIPDSKMLGKVVVKGNLPKTQLKGEGMLTTVAGSVLEKAGTMENLLDRIPNLTAQNGTLRVFGRGTPVVYVNGRKAQSSSDWEHLQADNIKSVEVITNPGARYEASTKSVVRITTKRPQGEGFSLDNTARATYNEAGQVGGYDDLHLTYRRGGLELGGNFFYRIHRQPDDKRIFQTTYLDQTWKNTTDITQNYETHSLYTRLNGSYAFNADHSIGARISFARTPKDTSRGRQQSVVTADGTTTETDVSDYTAPQGVTNVASNAYYTGKVGQLSIDFNTDWLWVNQQRPMNTYENYQQPGGEAQYQEVHSLTDTYYNLWASKLVFSLPLLGGNLSWGGEYSSSLRRSKYTVSSILDNDQNRFEEGMASAYVDYSRSFGRLNVQAGLRYEYVDFRYYDEGKYVPEQSKNYSNLFPSIALTMPLGDVQMQLGFATDITRPNYSYLRSGMQYDNRYLYETGNPFLMPQLSKNVNYALSYKWLSLTAMYSHISDPTFYVNEMYEDNPNIYVLKPVNWSAYDVVNASITLQPTFGFWHPSFTASVYKQWLDMDTHDGKLKNTPIGNFKFDNTFDTKYGSLTLMARLTTRGNQENEYLSRVEPTFNVSFHKSFLAGRLILQFYAYDILGTADHHMTMYTSNLREYAQQRYSCSTYSLTLRYKFNTSRSKYKGTGAGQSQKSRM